MTGSLWNNKHLLPRETEPRSVNLKHKASLYKLPECPTCCHILLRNEQRQTKRIIMKTKGKKLRFSIFQELHRQLTSTHATLALVVMNCSSESWESTVLTRASVITERQSFHTRTTLYPTFRVSFIQTRH